MPRELVYKDPIFEVWVDYRSRMVGWKNFSDPNEVSIKKSSNAKKFYEFHFIGRREYREMRHYDELLEDFNSVTELNRRVLGKRGEASRELKSADKAFKKVGECLYKIQHAGESEIFT